MRNVWAAIDHDITIDNYHTSSSARETYLATRAQLQLQRFLQEATSLACSSSLLPALKDAEVQHERRDVCWGHASDAGRLPEVQRPELVELFAGLFGHGGDGGVVQVLRQLARVLGCNLVELSLLAGDEAG
eukprot:5997819-Pyramimonas_sp.AAC.3